MHSTTAPRRQMFMTCRALVPALVALLLLAALAVAPPATPARAAANMVTDCGNDPTVSGTLPYAVANAAANATITFALDCNGTTAPNTTITLAATLAPAVNVTIDATAPLHTVTISGGGSVGLFLVNPGVTLSLRGLTLTAGQAALGGAIAVLSGTANVSGCTFTGSTATNGGAIYNGPGSTLRVVNSTFASNTAGGNGGAINNGGTATVVASTVTGNTANAGGRLGAGIYTGGAPFTLTLSAVSFNSGSGSAPDISGAVTSGGGNVIGNTARRKRLYRQRQAEHRSPALFGGHLQRRHGGDGRSASRFARAGHPCLPE